MWGMGVYRRAELNLNYHPIRVEMKGKSEINLFFLVPPISSKKHSTISRFWRSRKCYVLTRNHFKSFCNAPAKFTCLVWLLIRPPWAMCMWSLIYTMSASFDSILFYFHFFFIEVFPLFPSLSILSVFPPKPVQTRTQCCLLSYDIFL